MTVTIMGEGATSMVVTVVLMVEMAVTVTRSVAVELVTKELQRSEMTTVTNEVTGSAG